MLQYCYNYVNQRRKADNAEDEQDAGYKDRDFVFAHGLTPFNLNLRRLDLREDLGPVVAAAIEFIIDVNDEMPVLFEDLDTVI